MTSSHKEIQIWDLWYL